MRESWLKRRSQDLENAGPAAVPLLIAIVLFAIVFSIFMARIFTPAPP